MKRLISLITEEINNFDFLNNDKRIKENNDINILKTDEFQKQFIIDSIENNDKIKKTAIDTDVNNLFRKYGDIKNNYIDIHIEIGYEYNYDSSKEPALFNINFNGNRVRILDGELNNEEDINNIDWNQISASISSKNGDKIEFRMFRMANDRIKELFLKKNIRELLIHGLL